MVKRVLVLVMLQTCYCFVINLNRNIEMIKSLENLKSKINLTSPSSVPVPGPCMLEKPGCCVHTFRTNLQDVLRNVTINGTIGTERKKLEDNLKNLGKEQRDKGWCIMEEIPDNKNSWIKKYIRFLKKLNSNSTCSFTG